MAELTYEPVTWVNEGEETAETPLKYLDAANLNHLEQGVKAVTDEVNSFLSSLKLAYKVVNFGDFTITSGGYNQLHLPSDADTETQNAWNKRLFTVVDNWSTTEPVGAFNVNNTYLFGPANMKVNQLRLRFFFYPDPASEEEVSMVEEAQE